MHDEVSVPAFNTIKPLVTPKALKRVTYVFALGMENEKLISSY